MPRGKASVTGYQIALDYIKRGVLRIDNAGRIWRHATIDAHGSIHQIKPKRAEAGNAYGYLALEVWRNNSKYTVMAHRLVWIHFSKRFPPDDIDINHVDGNKANNSPNNLELATRAENLKHAIRNGLKDPSKSRSAKLTKEQVSEARQLKASGAKAQQIADALHVSKWTIYDLLNERTWKK